MASIPFRVCSVTATNGGFRWRTPAHTRNPGDRRCAWSTGVLADRFWVPLAGFEPAHTAPLTVCSSGVPTAVRQRPQPRADSAQRALAVPMVTVATPRLPAIHQSRKITGRVLGSRRLPDADQPGSGRHLRGGRVGHTRVRALPHQQPRAPQQSQRRGLVASRPHRCIVRYRYCAAAGRGLPQRLCGARVRFGLPGRAIWCWAVLVATWWQMIKGRFRISPKPASHLGFLGGAEGI